MACSSVARSYTICTRTLQRTPNSSLFPFLAPAVFSRQASSSTKKDGKAIANQKGGKKTNTTSKKKKTNPDFDREPLKLLDTFSLCDAMRYLRAFEVGQNPTSPKYELAVSLNTRRNTVVIRNQMKFPHGFGSAQRVAVICPPNSAAEQEAREAGAAIVGEESLLAQISQGVIEFDKLYCHPDSVKKLQQANVGRILGPKGLMPNEKNRTVTKDISSTLRSRVGGVDYKEKEGVIRLAIGQIGFSPKQMMENIKAFMTNLKQDIERAQERTDKSIHEVVLSSTHGPGFPLDRTFQTEDSIKPEQLTVF